MSNFFSQAVHFPTRDSSILDLILMDDPSMISDVRSIAPLGASDHLCVLSNIELVVNDNNSFITDFNDSKNFMPDHQHLGYYNINKTDWPLAINYLSVVDWNALLTCNYCINYSWEAFYSVVVYAISLCTPAKPNCSVHKRSLRKRTAKPRKSYPKHIRRLCCKKAKSWKRYNSRPSLCRKATYKRHAASYKIELDKHISSIENQLISSNNCRSFFQYVNKKMKPKSHIPSLIDLSGIMVVDNLQKANIFSSHFSSVFIVDNGVIPDIMNDLSTDPINDYKLNSVYFNSVNVYYQIKKLKSNSSPGLDGICALLLKNLINVIPYPLSLFFNLSLSSGHVPEAR